MTGNRQSYPNTSADYGMKEGVMQPQFVLASPIGDDSFVVYEDGAIIVVAR
ncbi:hypothetical protein T11_14456 [Trichinella zimbabwensis]|uniref:Uncharacterized protein n=1 Tax=Trichinella zimbabwensis TaxID=268475 RepID=A0A0V1GK04_9BILA|nr:hypothetical protein T11_14456 [Trichinella zimbabwensis]